MSMPWSKERLVSLVKDAVPEVLHVDVEFMPKSTIQVTAYAKNIRGLQLKIHSLLQKNLKDKLVNVLVVRLKYQDP